MSAYVGSSKILKDLKDPAPPLPSSVSGKMQTLIQAPLCGELHFQSPHVRLSFRLAWFPLILQLGKGDLSHYP